MVFPYVAYSDQLVLIGSNEPIQLNWASIEQRAASPFSQRHYGMSGIDIQALLAPYRLKLKLLPPLAGVPDEINTDLFPKDEYSIRGKDKIGF